MKRVLMVAYHYPPEGSSSGVLRTLKFSKYLPDHGWAPHVLTLRPDAYPVRDASLLAQIPSHATVHRTRGGNLPQRLTVAGRYPAVLAIPDRLTSWLPFGIARGVRIVREHRVSALYSTSPPATAHLIAAALKARTRLPWIADFRDPWIEDLHPRPRSMRRAFESWLERLVVRSADRVTVTTPGFRADMCRRHPGLNGRSAVLFNGYDEQDFESVTPLAPSSRFELLHAGLVTPDYRDPRPVLEALASLVGSGHLGGLDTRLVFLGGGPYLASRAFHATVTRFGLDGIVEVCERRPYAETLARMMSASALVLLQASDDTRFLIPAKAFEYLRARRPILAVTLPGDTADLIAASRAGYVVAPDDRDGMREAICRLRSGATGQATTRIEQYERRASTARLARMLDEVACAT